MRMLILQNITILHNNVNIFSQCVIFDFGQLGIRDEHEGNLTLLHLPQIYWICFPNFIELICLVSFGHKELFNLKK